VSLLSRNIRGIPRTAIFRSGRFDRPSLGIEHRGAFSIGPGHTVLCIGSCFAREVGRVLESAGVRSTFAGLTHRYNALNIDQTLRWAFEGGVGTEHFVRLRSGRWFDPYDRARLDTGYADPDEALAVTLGQLERLRAAAATADRVVITLGLTEVWRDTSAGAWLNHMPPVTTADPFAERFRVRATSVAENRDAIVSIVRRVTRVNPAARFVLSVSPIALNASFTAPDVLVATMRSKAVLRAAVDEAIAVLPAGVVDYFPSFEIVMYQRHDGVYRARDARGRPDRQHIQQAFIDRAVRPVFERAYLPWAGAEGNEKTPPREIRGRLCQSSGEDGVRYVEILQTALSRCKGR